MFFEITLLLCISVNLSHVFMNIANLFYILSSHSVSFNVNKDTIHTVELQSNITPLELWIIFPATFLFLLVWSKQKRIKSKNASSFLDMYDFFVS